MKTFILGLYLATAFITNSIAAENAFLGIPTPEFGIEEQAPAWPVQWPSSELTNHYYVDSDHPDATDSSNQFGYPDKPRSSFPEVTFAAGSYVEIHGGPYNGGGQIIFTGDGTVDNPVWVRGESSTERGEITGEMIVKGSYTIIENLIFSTDNAKIGIRPHNESHAHHISIRNNEIYGSGTDVGFTAAIGIRGSATDRFYDIVVYNNLIYNRGDHNPEASENDYHGILPSSNVDRVWILNNVIHNMGGDSVQVGVASLSDDQRASHIYISGNTFHDDHENAIDIKASNDVIVSNNELYGYEATGSSGSGVIVVHNNPNRVWILSNRVHGSPVGIISTGGSDVWFIGNIIHDIHTDDIGSWDYNSGYSDGVAIHFRATDGGALNNTLYNYDTGIQLTTAGPYELANNILIGRSQEIGLDIRVANSTVGAVTNIEHSLFDNSRINWGNGTINTSGTGDNFITEANTLTAPLTNDFSQAVDSSTINSGRVHEAYNEFYSLYGIRIDKDAYGNSRISGMNIDIGAVEGEAPNSPSSLNVTPN